MKELRVVFNFRDGVPSRIRRYEYATYAAESIKELYRAYNSNPRDLVFTIQVNGVLFAKPPGVQVLRKLLGTTA